MVELLKLYYLKTILNQIFYGIGYEEGQYVHLTHFYNPGNITVHE